MVKYRRVVALSPRFRRHVPPTILVVPLSTTAPTPVEPCHYELMDRYESLSAKSIWVKGNMLSHVSLGRLYPIFSRGRIITVSLSLHDLVGTRSAVSHALGLHY